MNVAVKWGLILGITVAVMGFVFGFASLQRSPLTALVFVGLAIVINVVVLILALREARHEATWGRQVVNGVVIGVVGAVLIAAGSALMTGVVIPDYYDQAREGYLEFFEAANLSDAEIDAQMAKFEGMTPLSGAISGAIGTVITSVVLAAIGGAFLRKK